MTAKEDNGTYTGTAKSAAFAVKALTYDKLQLGQVLKAGTTIVYDADKTRNLSVQIGRGTTYSLSSYTADKDCVIKSVSDSSPSLVLFERSSSLIFEPSAGNEGTFQSNNKNQDWTVAMSEFTLTSDQDEEIFWTVSSELKYDQLAIWADGERMVLESGENKSGTITLSSGTHDIIAVYWKDNSSSNGDDCATLTNTKLKPIVRSSDLSFDLSGIPDTGIIKIFAEEGSSFEFTANAEALIPFMREDMLNALGMDEDGLDIIEFEHGMRGSRKTIAHVSAASGAEAVRNKQGKYVLPVTFTVVPVMDENAGTYTSGSGEFDIGNGLAVEVYTPPIASTTTALLELDDWDDADFVVDFTDADGEAVIGVAGVGRINAKVGSAVTIHTSHPIRLGYTYGFEKRMIEAETGTDDDGMMTYTFTMPGFDVDVEYLYGQLSTEANSGMALATMFVVSGNQNVFEMQSSQIQSNNVLRLGDNGNLISTPLHVGEKVTVVSVERLSLFLNGKPFAGVTEDYGKVMGFDSYVYTISEMPEDTITMTSFKHQHAYTYEVQGNQLIRTCHNEDSCGEDNEAVVIAELCNDHSEGLGGEEFIEVVIPLRGDMKGSKESYLNAATSEFIYQNCSYGSEIYYPTDWKAEETVIFYTTVEINGSEQMIKETPLHAGSYVARAQVFVDTDEDPETEPEVYELELPYVINPYELTEENVHLEGWSFWQQNIDFNDPSHIIFTGQITGPSFHVTPYDSHNDNEEKFEEDRDYIVYGERSAYNPGHYTFYVEGIGDLTGTVQVDWRLGDDDMIAITPDMFEVEVEYYNGFARAVVIPTDERLANSQFKIGGTKISKTAGEFGICIQPNDGTTTGTVDLRWNADADKMIESAVNLAELQSRAVISQNKQKVFAGFAASVKSGYNVTDYGLIYCQDGTATTAEQLTLETVSNGSVKKAKYYSANITDLGSGVAAVGFVTVADAAGNTKTLYTDVMGGTFNELSEEAAYENVYFNYENVHGLISQGREKVFVGFSAVTNKGYTVEDYGLIYCQNGTAATAEQLTLEAVDNTNVKKAKYYSANITDLGFGVAAVGFVKVKDANGYVTTLYTGVMKNVTVEYETVKSVLSQGKQKVFLGFRANPGEGYTVEDYGLIYCQNGTATTAAQLTLDTVDNNNVKKAKYYSANITDLGSGVAAVGFVTIKDADGHVSTVYTQVMRGAYGETAGSLT